jgi:hypothetical protein
MLNKIERDNHMANQSIARRQTTDIVLPQDTSQELIQHTQAQLDTVRSLVGMGIVEYDLMYSQLKAYVERGGRSWDHQKYILERAGALLSIHNIAVDTTIRRGISDTLDNRFIKEVEVTRIVEVPRQGILPRLLGR